MQSGGGGGGGEALIPYSTSRGRRGGGGGGHCLLKLFIYAVYSDWGEALIPYSTSRGCGVDTPPVVQVGDAEWGEGHSTLHSV